MRALHLYTWSPVWRCQDRLQIIPRHPRHSASLHNCLIVVLVRGATTLCMWGMVTSCMTYHCRHHSFLPEYEGGVIISLWWMGPKLVQRRLRSQDMNALYNSIWCSAPSILSGQHSTFDGGWICALVMHSHNEQRSQFCTGGLTRYNEFM